MAIVEDGTNQWATIQNSAVGSLTTISFTPPAGALLIATATNGWNSAYSGTPSTTITYTDSLSGTWTPINNKNSGAASFTMVSSAYRVIGSSAAMTVTATFIDSAVKCATLSVRVLTGAATSGTIATSLAAVTGTTANFTQQTVTTTTTGSKPIIVAHSDAATALTVNANTTEYGQLNDGTVSSTGVAGRATSLTGTPGSLSIGWTGSGASTAQSVCVIEVMPATAVVSNAPPDRIILQAVKSSLYI